MTIIKVTRHYPGFRNVADTIELGIHTAGGSSDVETYTLPCGYTVEDGRVYDPSGTECALIAAEIGLHLISRIGSEPDQFIPPLEA